MNRRCFGGVRNRLRPKGCSMTDRSRDLLWGAVAYAIALSPPVLCGMALYQSCLAVRNAYLGARERRAWRRHIRAMRARRGNHA